MLIGQHDVRRDDPNAVNGEDQPWVDAAELLEERLDLGAPSGRRGHPVGRGGRKDGVWRIEVDERGEIAALDAIIERLYVGGDHLLIWRVHGRLRVGYRRPSAAA